MVSNSDIAGQKDVLIRIGTDISGVQKKLRTIRTNLNSLKKQASRAVQTKKQEFFPGIQSAKEKISSIRAEMTKVRKQALKRGSWSKGQTDYYKNLQTKLQETNNRFYSLRNAQAKAVNQIQSKYRPQIRSLNSQITTQTKKLNGLRSSYSSANTKLKTMQNQLQKSKKEFQGWALSLMFFGMAIQRLFTRIWKSSVKTFQDVHDSIEGSVTGFDRLQGSLKYLQFTAGQALEPVATALLPVISSVQQWVEENPKLFRQLTVIGIVLGTVLMVLGMVTLAIFGFMEAGSKLMGVLALLKPVLIGAFTGISAPIWAVVAIVAAVAAAIYGIWTTNFANIKGFLTTTMENVMNMFKGIWDGIKNIFSGFTDFITGVFTGNWKKAFRGLVKILQGFGKIIYAVFKTIGTTIYNVIIWVIKAIVTIVENSIVSMIGAIKHVARMADDVLGTNLASKYRSAQDKVRDFFSFKDDLGYTSNKEVDEAVKTEKSKKNLIKNYVDITLDGEKVAKKVSERQLKSTKTNGG